MQLPDTETAVYDPRSIAMHWLSALLVLGLWSLGQCIDFFPRGDARVFARSLHIAFGLLLALQIAARMVWRLRFGVKLPHASPGVAGRAAVGVHHLLYLLVVLTVVVGVACVWIRGDNLFNLIKLPEFDPGNKALRHDAVELHETLANALLILAGLHAAAALFHHHVLKDAVLRRMWPRLGRKG